MNKLLRLFLIFCILVINIGCDQASKHYVRNNFGYHDAVRLMSNHVTLTKVENTGAFLSLGADMNSLPRFLFLELLPLAFLVGCLAYLFLKRNLDKVTTAGLCLLTGGGAGNLFDRIYHGSVTDFLHIDFILFQTGVFNIADISITTGLIILVFKPYILTHGSRLSPF